ncbi:MAG: hypothetical protein LBD30_00780 [Verrucomicrobiales bacterium]|jgi:hypothetical protein|nr:hypothetical protein [Verrucomicrobiales bacterium]
MSKKITLDVSDEIMDKCQRASEQIARLLPVAVSVPPLSLLQISMEAAFHKEDAVSIAKKFVKSLTKSDWPDADANPTRGN